jgi:hypothetical protein
MGDESTSFYPPTLTPRVNIFNTDSQALDFKPSFPFRPATFTVNPAKTAAKFSWAPAASLDDDLKMWADQYTALSNNEETQGASKEEDVKIMMVSS